MNHRLPALDWMRGLVMMIMVTDHAGEAFNANRPVTDSAMLSSFDQQLDTVEFLVRWASHLCAPVFVFLAGTSLALSLARKQERGMTAWQIDRDLLLRGAIILAVEYSFIDLLWMPDGLLLQVMFAIGASMILMVVFRRLPSAVLMGITPVLFLLNEVTSISQFQRPTSPRYLIESLFLNGGYFTDAGYSLIDFSARPMVVAYPILPWCSVMILGWILGRWLVLEPTTKQVQGWLGGLGAACLALYALVRGVNLDVGNLGLLRSDNSLVQWLHVSKYPPSFTFMSLELGIMFLGLALFTGIAARRGDRVNPLNPMLVFGQTALFFYLAHILILHLAAMTQETYGGGTLTDSMLASAITLAVLYPICLLYRQLKARKPGSLLRYF